MTTMNAKRWMMAAMAAVLVMGLSACSDAGVTAPSDDSAEMIALNAITIPNPDMSQPDMVMGGTIDEDYAMERPEGRGRRMPFGGLLRELKLDSVQLEQAKACIKGLDDCMKAGMESIRAQQKEVLAGFRDQRKGIIDAYKNGDITREDAAAQLKELQAAIREAMAPLHEQAKAVAEACRTQFHDCLRAFLTEEQQAILDAWIAKQGQGGPGRGGEGGDDHGGRGPGGGRRP